MIEFKLIYYKLKRDTYYWMLGKIESLRKKPKTIEEIVYDDILSSFTYGQQICYKLGINSLSLDEVDLKLIIQQHNNDYSDIKEEDLIYIYNQIVSYLKKKFRFSPNVKIIDYDNHYFEIHWVNYKQIK